MKKKAAIFWSGGKDSAFALYHIQKNYPDLEVCRMITTLNKEYRRISMHGVREELLDSQARALEIPLEKMWVPEAPDNSAYELELHRTLSRLKLSGIEHLIFGDIFLQDLKQYRDNILAQHQITGVYPLWKRETHALISDFVSLRFRTVTCCIGATFPDKTWLGREIDDLFIRELPAGIDPCGENGEFHTFCFDGPVFKSPVRFYTGEERFVSLNVKKTGSEEEAGFWYIDLLKTQEPEHQP